SVPERQTVGEADRVRTGPGARARLVYFEGTATEIGPDTGLLIQRLEQSPGGNVVARLFQTVGTTVNRVVRLTDPAASFEIETPAATALVRGTTPRVQVAPCPSPTPTPRPAGAPSPDTGCGVTRVANLPDGTGGTVNVVGKDSGATQVTLQPGQETTIIPGQPPGAPTTISGGSSLSVSNSSGAQIQTVTVGPGEETRVRPGQVPEQSVPIGTYTAQDAAQAASAAAAQEAAAASAQAAAAGNAAATGAGMAASQAAAAAAFAQAAAQAAAQQGQAGASTAIAVFSTTGGRETITC